MAQGKGKESFRVFTKQVNQLRRYTEHAIKSGEVYTMQQVEQWFGDMLDYYGNFLSDEGLDYELWFSRGEAKASEIIRILADKYRFDDGEPDNSEDSEEFEADNENESGEILGHPIITLSECEQDGNARMRGQILLTKDELEEYLKDIPAGVIRGIIIRRDEDGKAIGFSICGQRNTD